ncbi:MAG: aminoglycoside phosphotransferase family protein [Chloroflexota bacterium]
MSVPQTLLSQFNLDANDFIGAGSESAVYSLNDAQIVRFYGEGDASKKVETLKAFYDRLAKQPLPFKVPKIESFGEKNGRYFSIEVKRLGSALTEIMPTLSHPQRKIALKTFIQTSAFIKKIEFPQAQFGEILTLPPIQDESWSGFLIKRIRTTFNESMPTISRDVPHIEAIFSEWQSLLPKLGTIEPQLVHGDFYWGNVLGDERGMLTPVLDFSPMTVIGDWRLDVVTSKIFLELTEGVKPADIHQAKKIIDQILGEESAALEQIYRLYYALYYSFTKESDPPLYRWCVQQLRSTSPI